MLGKSVWFQRRKYGGWGICPKTWQGYAYIAVIVGLFFLIQYLPLGEEQNTLIATIAFAILASVDMIDIMIHLPMDERERIHEAKAERNALWVMLIILIAGTFAQAVTSAINNSLQIDPVIIAALIGAVITKAITNIHLEHKN